MRASLPLFLTITLWLPGVASGQIAEAIERAKSGTFEALGEVQCAQEVGQSLGTCSAWIARANRSAAALVTFSNGFSRMLMFSDGKFVRGNATMSGVGTDADWHLSDGIYFVRVDDQRFELPEALVFGDRPRISPKRSIR